MNKPTRKEWTLLLYIISIITALIYIVIVWAVILVSLHTKLVIYYIADALAPVEAYIILPFTIIMLIITIIASLKKLSNKPVVIK